MHKDALALIRDTITYLKDPLTPKQAILTNGEEHAFFQKKSEVKKPPVETPILAPAPPIRPKVEAKIEKKVVPEVKREEVPPPAVAPIKAVEEKSPVESSSPIKKTLQRIAPQIKLVDQVPSDEEAKRIANAWKEKLSDVEVVLLACDTQPDTLELLKGLAKAIDQNLAKSKVISAERLEREKRWDLFLEKNPLRLIIASDGMQQCTELMRFYRAVPSQAQFFLNQTPLFVLSKTSLYKSLEHKALLWKTLCQMLKK
jgi:hypothetical protein